MNKCILTTIAFCISLAAYTTTFAAPGFSGLPESLNVTAGTTTTIGLSTLVSSNGLGGTDTTIIFESTEGVFYGAGVSGVTTTGAGTGRMSFSGDLGVLRNSLGYLVRYNTNVPGTIEVRSFFNHSAGNVETVGTMNVYLVNRAPTGTGLIPNVIGVTANRNSDIDLSATNFADLDGDNVTVTLTVSSGTLSASSRDMVTVTPSQNDKNESVLTLVGHPDDINAYLDNTSAIQHNTAHRGRLQVQYGNGTTSTTLGYRRIVFASDFVTTWELPNGGASIRIGENGVEYNYDVILDGATDCYSNNNPVSNLTGLTGKLQCYLPGISTPGRIHYLILSGNYPQFSADSLMRSVEQWGANPWSSFRGRFASNPIKINALDVPDLSNMTSMYSMFNGNAVANPDVSRWDTSNIEDIGYMFNNASAANPDVSRWDVSGLNTTIYSLFAGSSFSSENYDALLRNWSTQDLQPLQWEIRNTALTYCEVAAREVMVGKGWNISGDSAAARSDCVARYTPTVVELPERVVVPAGRLGNIDLSETTFVAANKDALSVTLEASAGSFSAVSRGGVTVTVSDSTLELSGGLDNIHEYLADDSAIQYNTSAASTIAVTANNGENDAELGNINVYVDTDVFITTWTVPDGGGTVTVPVYPVAGVTGNVESYDPSEFAYTIDCREGRLYLSTTCVFTNDTGEDQNYSIHIYGKFPGIYIGDNNQKNKLATVEQWGSAAWHSMYHAFNGATNLTINPNAGIPETSAITNMRGMFTNALAANPDVSGWDVSAVTNAIGMFRNTGLSTANYDKLLAGWSTQTLQTGVTFGATGVKYCDADARTALINKGWTITDAGVEEPETCAVLAVNLDIDGNGGSPRASTDGILIARYIASVRGPSLIAGAVAGGASRTTSDDIEAYLEMLSPADQSASNKPLDIDGNGEVRASTDGILIARYIASVRGPSLIAGAVAGGASRDYAAILAHLQSLDVQTEG